MKRVIPLFVLAMALLSTGCNSNNTAVPPHTVTFDSKGGSYTPRVQYIKDGDYAIEPLSPTKSDTFGFRRWKTAENGDDAFSFNSPIKSDITLYAEYWPIKDNDTIRKLTHSMTYYWNIIRTIIENESFAKGNTVEASFAYTGDRKNYASHSKTEKDLAYILSNSIALKDEANNESTLAYYNAKEEEEYYVKYATDDDFKYEIHSETKCDSNKSTVDGSLYNIDIENFKIALYGYKAGETIDSGDSEGEYKDVKEPFSNTFTSVISLKGTVNKSSADNPEYEIRMDVTADGTKKTISMSFVKPKDAASEYVIHFTAEGYTGYLIYR